MSTFRFEFSDPHLMRAVLGERDRNIETLENVLGVEIIPRGTDLNLKGSKAKIAEAIQILKNLVTAARRGTHFSPSELTQTIDLIIASPENTQAHHFPSGHTVRPKTRKQLEYLETIRNHSVVLSWGPAGTGKTYLAMAMAVSALLNQEVQRIILTRPAVEAGEKLGFLPGDIAEKVNPYLRPLYDALHDMMPFEKAEQLVSHGVIEVAPLAFMRGRTLNHSFVILDEAQNTTPEQMRMFLTRLGFDSKAVITGDITQIDLAKGQVSGLKDALDALKNVEGIGFLEFSGTDVVRHPLVQKIIKAYESRSKKK